MSYWWHKHKRKVVFAVAVLGVLVAVARVWSQPFPERAAPLTTSAAIPAVSTAPSDHSTQQASGTHATSTTQQTPPSTQHTPTTQQTPPSTQLTPSTQHAGSTVQGHVIQVIDGDTLRARISGGGQEEVRLIGIDAPEEDEPFFAEAKHELAKLVQDQTVLLELDAEERDQYGRLLAYVWMSELLVNAELLRLGVCTVYTVPPNVKYVEQLLAAQEEAKRSHHGMWGAQSDSPVKIVEVNYDDPGNDNYNLNEEYVVFEVVVSGTLLGYSVQNEAGHRYRFPDLVFEKGDVFRLHSGQGKDTQTDLYWGAKRSAIWNNNGDTVKVLDPQGQIVESYRY